MVHNFTYYLRHVHTSSEPSLLSSSNDTSHVVDIDPKNGYAWPSDLTLVPIKGMFWYLEGRWKYTIKFLNKYQLVKFRSSGHWGKPSMTELDRWPRWFWVQTQPHRVARAAWLTSWKFWDTLCFRGLAPKCDLTLSPTLHWHNIVYNFFINVWALSHTSYKHITTSK